MKLLEKSKNYAIQKHFETNHKYNRMDYSFHLEMVYEYAKKYQYMVDENDVESFLSAAWCHDLIEDCRETYNDVLKETNFQVAELVYALTNEKGKNRKERGSKKHYDEMKMVKYATLLKCCDRMANFKFSIDSKSRMSEMYSEEMNLFVIKIYQPEYSVALNDLLKMDEDYRKSKYIIS